MAIRANKAIKFLVCIWILIICEKIETSKRLNNNFVWFIMILQIVVLLWSFPTFYACTIIIIILALK